MYYHVLRMQTRLLPTCKQMVVMKHGDLEGHSITNISSPFHQSVLQRTGRPRKYEGSWFSSNKRIHFAKLMLKKLRAIKSSYILSSNDAVVQHLIEHP